MCGRYATTRSAADLAALFEAVAETGDLRPRYNVAPTDPVPVVRHSRRVGRVLSAGRWGLLPPWATHPRAGAKMINARAETVATSRAYGDAFATRRALVPADGWYEWHRDAATSQAYFITPSDGSVLALAGVWRRWGPEEVLTFSVITTAATGAVARIHPRMPLILPPERWHRWLSGPADPALLAPCGPEVLDGLELRPVGPAVGNVRNDGPELMTRVHPAPVTTPLW